MHADPAVAQLISDHRALRDAVAQLGGRVRALEDWAAGLYAYAQRMHAEAERRRALYRMVGAGIAEALADDDLGPPPARPVEMPGRSLVEAEENLAVSLGEVLVGEYGALDARADVDEAGGDE